MRPKAVGCTIKSFLSFTPLIKIHYLYRSMFCHLSMEKYRNVKHKVKYDNRSILYNAYYGMSHMKIRK